MAKRFCYFGAAPDTSNLGVSALCYSVLGSLAQVDPATQVTVFDYGRGLRRETTEFATGPFTFERCGAAYTRRIYRRESLYNIRLSSRLGGLGNPAARRLLDCDAVLDISGGDSFTDLYGPHRFALVMYPKRLALELGKPLILLPQTYGPYHDPAVRRAASEIVRRAAQAWARDPRSYEVLKELAGPDFDPQRHRNGVDVAFALEPRRPRTPLPEPIATWLADEPGHRPCPVIGFNVSGLIWNDPKAAVERYGFKADYREVVLGFLRRVLAETDAKVVLVPHVYATPTSVESDPAANEQVTAELGAIAANRLASVPPLYSCNEMKWIISRMNWFCGTRMHSTIAALSSGVPTAAIAYSPKTLGVFEICGQGACVTDPRMEATDVVVERLRQSCVARGNTRAALADASAAMGRHSAQQLRLILAPASAVSVPPGAPVACVQSP